MIKNLFIMGFFFPIFVACTSSLTTNKNVEPSNAPVNDSPVVRIVYATLFDEVCSVKYDYPLRQEWKDELLGRLVQWRELFEREGMQLLGEAIRIIGQPFPDRTIRVSLSLCSFPSISTPLIVNARYALRRFTADPITDDVLIGTIVHEILHNYLDYFQFESSAISREHPGSSKSLVNHVYLFALLKATYLKLGWDSKLNEMVKKDRSLPNGDYKKAWNIVNKGEYMKIVDELKAFPFVPKLGPKI